jgi:hypothetical protein
VPASDLPNSVEPLGPHRGEDEKEDDDYTEEDDESD